MRTQQLVFTATRYGPLVLVIVLALSLVAVTDVVLIKRQFNDSLIVFSSMFRVAHGQVPGDDYIVVLGHLTQMLPGLFFWLTDSALSAYILTNASYVILCAMILQLAVRNSLTPWAHWAAIGPIFLLCMSHACIFRAYDISMSYNRWGMVVLCSFVVWLYSLDGSNKRQLLREALVIGGTVAVLYLTKVTFAMGAVIIVLFACRLRLLTLKCCILAGVIFTSLLLAIEILYGGIAAQLSQLLLMSGVRKVVDPVRFSDALYSSSTELYLFCISLVAFLVLAKKSLYSKLLLSLLAFVVILCGLFITSQNAGQHKIVLCLFTALALASLAINSIAYAKNSFLKKTIVVLSVVPLYFYMINLLWSPFYLSNTSVRVANYADLSEINEKLAGFYLDVANEAEKDTDALTALSAGADKPFAEFMKEFDRGTYGIPSTLNEQFEWVLNTRKAVTSFCKRQDRVAAIAWVDPTPLSELNTQGFGYLNVHWGDSINNKKYFDNKSLFATTDCLLIPKVFFSIQDHALVNFYRPMVLGQYKLSGDNLYWEVYRKKNPFNKTSAIEMNWNIR